MVMCIDLSLFLSLSIYVYIYVYIYIYISISYRASTGTRAQQPTPYSSKGRPGNTLLIQGMPWKKPARPRDAREKILLIHGMSGNSSFKV